MEAETPKKSFNLFSQFTWWKISDEELEKQVSGYNILKFYQSARGTSALLILFSVAVNVLAVVFSLTSEASLIDAFILLLFVPFVWKGFRLALILIMIFWTLEKILSVVDNPTSIVISLIWWSLYMHTFLLAFKVEQLRRKSPVASSPKEHREELQKLWELKNTGKITEEDYTRLQKEIVESN